MNKFATHLLAGAALAGVLESPAMAQSAQDDSGAAPARAVVDTVTVTALRRSETLQDVPVTVTAFTAEEIENARIHEVTDVAIRTPGLSFDAFPATQPRLYIRGVGSPDRGAGGDPSAAVFLDEVYLGRPASVAFDAFDVERIEVLKGPQGTLYGRNVVGGAINVVTASPDLDDLYGSVEATAGNYERAETAGFINIPLADGSAAFRASGSIRTHGGYVDNVYTGGDVEDQDTRSLRLQGRVVPTDAIELRLTVDSTTDRHDGPAQHVVDVDPNDPLSAFWTINRDRDYNAAQFDGYQDRDTWGARGQAIWDLAFGSLNYLVSHRELAYDVNYDFDGGNPTFNPISIGGGNVEDSSMFSQELRLQSPSSSAWTWVVGLYEYRSDIERSDILSLGIGGPAGLEIYDQQADIHSRAVYGDLTVPITDRFNLSAGLRYTEDEKEFAIRNTRSQALFRAGERFDVSTSETWDAVTWRVTADYHLSAEHMVYGSVSRGFKSGGFQDTPADRVGALDSFDPEYATQYEIGQRGEFLDGSLIWNNTLYWMDYTDLQSRETIGLSIVTNNAGAATIKGYETQLDWNVAGGFNLTGTYAYTDGVFDTFVEGAEDYSGNRISRTPEHKLVVTPSYEFDWPSGASLLLAADYQYASRIFDDSSNTGPEQRDPTHFVDARAIYTSANAAWSLSVWGKNLTDEVTRTHQATFLGGTFASYNPPPTFGATLRWNY